MDRCKRCLFRSRDEWVKRLTGMSGTVVLWFSIGSIIMASVYRENCTADASVVPMLLLPTGIMGIFTSVFSWLYVTFLWSEDAYDPLKYLTYVAGVITGLLQFVTFGFSASKLDHPDCVDPFLGFSFGITFFLGILFTFIIVLTCIHRTGSSSVGPGPL